MRKLRDFSLGFYLVALLACATTVALPPLKPAVQPQVFDTVVCEDTGCTRPISGVQVKVHTGTSPDTFDTQTSNGDGYNLWTEPATLVNSDLTFSKDGYFTLTVGVLISNLVKGHNHFQLLPIIAPLPPPPTRDEMLDLHITFQGLTVTTQQFGRLPWFEASLPWLTPADRQTAYDAKKVSSAWEGGDTHAIINLPSGPPLYDEPGQPYSADRFPALDWTAGGTHIDNRLADLVAEVAYAGFPRELLFLGGDDGDINGFPIAMHQLDLVHQALRVESKYGDLGPYVTVLPGWDGVFYGYTPEHVAQWGAKCRQLFVYCGLEHQPGKIPVGEGGNDFLPGGRMSTFDLLLAEFFGPNDTEWRQTLKGRDAQGRPDYNGNQIWQIGARMLGALYHRPGDQPADSDSYSGAGYLAPGTSRGPYAHCAFEWVGEYLWVRDQEAWNLIIEDRDYFKSLGYTCGG